MNIILINNLNKCCLEEKGIVQRPVQELQHHYDTIFTRMFHLT